MPKSMGYPLPSGDAYTDELACMMLFYPDKPEYRQALFGALDYFATWLAWERDPDKKGQDAAKAWREAIEATRECIEMNTCETILQLLTEIRDNTGVYCCDTMDITDGDRYTDAVEDGVGDVPQNIIDAGYATGTSDWAGFDDYKCMISHLMVDNMSEQLEKIQTIIDESGAALVTVAVLASIAATILTGGGYLLVAGILLGVASAAGLYAAFAEVGEAGLPNLIDAMDEHHDELACAIYNADGSAGAVDDLKDKIDELFNVAQAALLKSLNLPAQLKALYAGRYDQQDIADLMDTNGYETGDYTCDCEQETLFDYQFPADEQGYDVDVGVITSWVDNHLVCNPNTSAGWRMQPSEIGTAAGTRFTQSAPFDIKSLKARFRFDSNGQSTFDYRVYFFVVESITDTRYDSPTYLSSAYAWDTWHEIEHIFPAEYTVRTGLYYAGFYLYRASSAAAGQRFNLDWIKYYSAP